MNYGRWSPEEIASDPALLAAEAVRRAEIDRVAGRRPGATEKPQQPRLVFASPASLAGKPVPEQKWLVRHWLPAATVALLYGAGGEGKTLLLQMLMTSTASGRPWLGLDVEPGVAIGLFSEDDEDEMHRRQEAINQAMGVSYEDLADMHWTVPVGTDNTLIRFEQDGAPKWTDRYLDFADQVRALQPSLIVLDVAADLYGGNENDRGQVAQFLKAQLGSLARETGAVILIAAHPSKSSISSGDLDSGSTGWNGGVRTRLTLATPKGEDGEQVDEDARVLRRAKANRAKRGDEIELVFRDRVLQPKQGIGHGVVAGIDKENAERVFLDLLAKVIPQGRHVSDSRNSQHYAPKMFAQMPERHGFKQGDFRLAMNALFSRGLIRVEHYGKPSDRTKHIVRVDPGEGGAQEGEGGGEG